MAWKASVQMWLGSPACRKASLLAMHCSFWRSDSPRLPLSMTSYPVAIRMPISRAAWTEESKNQYWSLKVVVPVRIISRQETFVAQYTKSWSRCSSTFQILSSQAGKSMSSPMPRISDIGECVCILMRPGMATMPEQSMMSRSPAISQSAHEPTGPIRRIRPFPIRMSLRSSPRVTSLRRMEAIRDSRNPPRRSLRRCAGESRRGSRCRGCRRPPLPGLLQISRNPPCRGRSYACRS